MGDHDFLGPDRPTYNGVNLALANERHLDLDSRDVTDPITDFPEGISSMKASATADWVNRDIACLIVTYRTGSDGWQQAITLEGETDWAWRFWNPFVPEWYMPGGDWEWDVSLGDVDLKLTQYFADLNLDSDAFAESAAITSFPDRVSNMPVTSGANWGPNAGEAGHVITVRDGSTGKQIFSVPSTGISYTRYYTEGAWGAWKSQDPPGDASTTVKGLVKISVAPASSTNPIAVGDNDGRVPSQDENNALQGTDGTPSDTNRYVTDSDARNTDARTPTAHTHSGDILIPNGIDLPEQGSPSSPSADRGRLYTLDVGGKTEPEYRDSSGVVGRPFLDTYFVAQNTTGSTIPKGSVVRVSGQSASRVPLIALADSDASATMPAAGITMESIANNAYGRVMVQGVLTALATTGLTAGAAVYASGTAGAITATAPVYPAFRQVLGSVMSVHGSTGEIFVNVSHFFRQVGTPVPVPFFYGSTLAVTTGVGRSPITTGMVGYLTEVRAAVNTAPTGAAIGLTLKKNGSSVTTFQIAASSNSGSTTIASVAVVAGDYLSVDITQVGSTVAGSDLTVVAEIMTAA